MANTASQWHALIRMLWPTLEASGTLWFDCYDQHRNALIGCYGQRRRPDQLSVQTKQQGFIRIRRVDEIRLTPFIKFCGILILPNWRKWRGKIKRFCYRPSRLWKIGPGACVYTPKARSITLKNDLWWGVLARKFRQNRLCICCQMFVVLDHFSNTEYIINTHTILELNYIWIIAN